MKEAIFKKYGTVITTIHGEEINVVNGDHVFARDPKEAQLLLNSAGKDYMKVRSVLTEEDDDVSFQPIDPDCPEPELIADPYFLGGYCHHDIYTESKIIGGALFLNIGGLGDMVAFNGDNFQAALMILIDRMYRKTGNKFERLQVVCESDIQDYRFTLSISMAIIGSTVVEKDLPKIDIYLMYEDDPSPDKIERILFGDYRFHAHGFSQERFGDIQKLLLYLPSVQWFSMRNNDFTGEQEELIAEILLKNCNGRGKYVDLRGMNVPYSLTEKFVLRKWKTVRC